MRLLVVGADGVVGREVVGQGLGHGHEIIAVGGEREPDSAHERLTAIPAVALQRDEIAGYAEGADAVLVALRGSTLGPPSAPFADTTASVVSAMKLARVRRLVALSSAGVGESLASVPLLQRMRISALRRGEYDDLARMEEVVLFSGLDWTLLRPAPLTDGPLTGLYRVRDNVLPERGRTVSSADAAALMLKSLSSQRYVGRIVALAD